MRKFVLAAVALMFTFGIALAAEVTFLSYDKDTKELKVKDGDKEKTYKITDKTTFKTGDKDYEAEKGIDRLTKMNENEKTKGKAKIDVTGEGGKATEVKFPMRKKKDK
jgi:hypothetical protein